MSDVEGELSEALRESIRRMDGWLSEVEAAYLASPKLRGAEEKRCRAVTTFSRLRVDIESGSRRSLASSNSSSTTCPYMKLRVMLTNFGISYGSSSTSAGGLASIAPDGD